MGIFLSAFAMEIFIGPATDSYVQNVPLGTSLVIVSTPAELGIVKDGMCARATYADPSPPSFDVLADVARVLAPGGSLTLRGAGGESSPDVLRTCIMAGLVDGKVDNNDIVAAKPDWEVGTANSLNIRRPMGGASSSSTAAGAPLTWSLGGNDLVDDDNGELIDEDDLLGEDDVSQVIAANDDCETGPGGVRKACKDCSCGRAEAEESGATLTKEQLENPTSSCGSCYLGDAFRCGSCPYRGLPPFQPGEKIDLN